MTTTHRTIPALTRLADHPRAIISLWVLAGLVIGAAPGLILVLLAEFVIDGEMQLTVGAPGIILAVVGAVVGAVVAGLRARHHHGA